MKHIPVSLQWRQNGCDGVSDHQPHDCLLNRSFRYRSKKTSKLRVTGLCEGNSPVTCEFPTQRASNAGNVSIWWRHHYTDLGPVVFLLVMATVWYVVAAAYLVLFLTSASFGRGAEEPRSEHNSMCDENPPPCDAGHTDYPDANTTTFTLGKNKDFYEYMTAWGINTSQAVCSLDPLVAMNFTRNIAALWIRIECAMKHTRVVLKPTRHLHPLRVVLEIKNCVVYWKDIATLGLYIDVNALHLKESLDEFADGKPEYFSACVRLKDSPNGTMESEVGPPISGLVNVYQIEVDSPRIQPVSPVFTRHLWPAMAVIVFVG